MDVTVERASIALLLGDARRAAELLGLGGAAAAANPDVLAFVKVRRLPPARRLALRLGWEGLRV